LNAETLDRLCTFFRVQPGALLEWSPDERSKRAARGDPA
jgi:DNA-binding Xre family transcriptional regulator